MIAAKRAAAYDSELKQLFSAINLRGDGVIHKDEFLQAQAIVAETLGNADQAHVMPPSLQITKSPQRLSLAVQELIVSPCCKPVPPMSSPPARRPRIHRSRSLAGPPGHASR